MSKTTRHWIGILVLWNLLQTIPISSISTDIGRHLFDHDYNLRAYDYKRIAHVENYLSASNADYLTDRETESLKSYCDSPIKLDHTQ